MPDLSKTLTVYHGADLTPTSDFTDETVWERTELYAMANDGEAAAGTWVLHDDEGIIPDRVTNTFLSAHNPIKVTVGSNTLFRGRIAAQDTRRGDTRVGRHREWTITTEDQNAHLRGIIVHNWSRPAETDAARVQALVAAYLSGNYRASTNLNGSNHVVLGSNLVSLPAKVYTSMEPMDILREIATEADKEVFVTVDDELAYFGHDYAGYDSILRISDDFDDLNTVTCLPITPSTSEFSREILTALRTYWRDPEGTDDERSIRSVSQTGANLLDLWEGAYHDAESENFTEATAKHNAMFALAGQSDINMKVTIGRPGVLPDAGGAGQPMTGDDVWKIKPGQRISVKSAVLRGGRDADGTFRSDSFQTVRVRGIRWSFPAADSYFATLDLERPKKAGPRSGGSRRPQPPPQCQIGGTEVLYNGINPDNDACLSGTYFTSDGDPFFDSFAPAKFHATGGSETDCAHALWANLSSGSTYSFSVDIADKPGQAGGKSLTILEKNAADATLATHTFPIGGHFPYTKYTISGEFGPLHADYDHAHFIWPTFYAKAYRNVLISSESAVTNDPDCIDYVSTEDPHSPYYMPADEVIARDEVLQEAISSIAQAHQIFRPSTYGAAVDGTTDDTSAFDDCRAAAEAAGAGATIELDEGTMVIDPTAMTRFTVSGLTIRGKGRASVIKWKAGTYNLTDEGLLNFEGSSGDEIADIVLEDFDLDGNRSNVTNSGNAFAHEGAHFNYGLRPVIRDVHSRHFHGEAFDFDNTTGHRVIRGIAEDIGGSGYHTSTGSSYGLFTDCLAIDCGQDNDRSGFDTWHDSLGLTTYLRCKTVQCNKGFNFDGDDSTVIDCEDYDSDDPLAGSGTGNDTSGLTAHKRLATAAPGVTDDSADAFRVGSTWFDVTNDVAYVCVDDTASSAEWTQVGGDSVTAATVSAVGRWEPVTNGVDTFVWDGDEIVVHFVETP